MEANNESFVLDARLDMKEVASSPKYMNIRWRLRSPTVWNKFVVLSASHIPKEVILLTIINALHPIELIPFMFHIKNKNCIFYARECMSAIDVIALRFNFQIQNPPDEPLYLQIELMTSDMVTLVKTEAILNKTLTQKYKKSDQYMDLSDFHKNEDQEKLMFCPLSIPRVLSEVLTQCGQYSIVSLNLSNNFLKSMDNARFTSLTNLRILNLSCNELNISSLEPLTSIPLRELILDGNPLCSSFNTEKEYVNAIKKYCPGLKKLDGVVLSSAGPPRMAKFFLCVPGKQFVEQFIEHYFSLYDSAHRNLLLGAYHPEAQFSITTSYLPGQTTSAFARLTRYVSENRNLIRLSDYNKINQLVRKGREEIMEVLNKLPETRHDPTSFTADLIYHSPQMALLTISGVFREPENSNVSLRFFKRQFTLLPELLAGSAYQIINEMLFVNNATTAQDQVAFKQKSQSSSILPIYLSCKSSSKCKKAKKNEMIDTLTEVTEMNRLWCRKCLIDVKWDIRAALISFNDCYKAETIPQEAFFKY